MPNPLPPLVPPPSCDFIPNGGAAWGLIVGTLSDQTDLQLVLDGKAPLVHTHPISDIVNLQPALDAKAPLAHTHLSAHITDSISEWDVGGDGKLLKSASGGNLSLNSFNALSGVPGFFATFSHSGMTILNGSDVSLSATLLADNITANREFQYPDADGFLASVPGFVDLAAANLALAAGDFFWDTTLKKLRQATA